MVSMLYDFPFIQYKNFVGIDYSGKAVSNNERGGLS